MKTATQSPVLIKPTVGRVVWFYPDPRSGDSGFQPPDNGKPLAAVIAYVHSDTMVNLAVFDANGVSHNRTSVYLVHDTDNNPYAGHYCTWMPFQRGQAKAQDAAASTPAQMPFEQRSHRQELEAIAVRGLADSVVGYSQGGKLGAAIRDALDAMLSDRAEVSGGGEPIVLPVLDSMQSATDAKQTMEWSDPLAIAKWQKSRLYASIKQAMELIEPRIRSVVEYKADVTKAHGVLFCAFWSETPIPAGVIYPDDWVEAQNADGLFAALGQLADDGRYGVSRIEPDRVLKLTITGRNYGDRILCSPVAQALQQLVDTAQFCTGELSGKWIADNGIEVHIEAIPQDFTSLDAGAPLPARSDEGRYGIAGMTFGQAIEVLKTGGTVARKGWNGKGMFVYMVPPASYPVQTGAAVAHFGAGSMVPYAAYLAIKTVDGTVSTWAPSVGDCLAEDWVVLE